jgi:hypothetical protein
MATFYDIYQYYLNNPNAIPGGISGVSGITPVAPVATPTSSQGIMSAVPQGSLVENGSGDNSSQIGTAPTSSSGTSIGNAISNAISSIGSMSTGRAIGTAIGYGLGLGPIGTFGLGQIGSSFGGGTTAGPGGVDQGTGPGGCDTGVDQGVGPGGCATGTSTDQGVGPGGCATGTSGPGPGPGPDTGTGPGGCDSGPGPGPGPGPDAGTGPGGCDSGPGPGPSTDPGTGPGGCSNGGGDGGSGPGGADAGTGPGGCGLAKGGRVGFSNGSSGQDYWITVQEMYDNAGGEAGTGLGLIDFANKYFPKMANGGRVGMAGGGVSQGLDYLMGIERRGYAVGGTGPSPDAAETYSEYKARMLEALRKSHGGQKTANTDLQPDGSYSGVSREIPIEDYFNYMLADAYALGFNPNTGLKFGVDDRGVLTDQYKFEQEMADFKKNSQTTPTEDFSDYLNTTTINTNAQTKPTVAEQMMSPEDALTPEVPQENPIQKHLDFNEFLKGQGLSQQDYNVLGGYDVAQNLAPGNPILGGAINLASPVYNAVQMFNSAKDAQGNVIKQYVPDMYEDATESGAYYAVPLQKISDIPGSAARNIQGGLGLLSDRQKQSYQDIRNQYETQRQKSAFERFTGAAGPLAENINTAISSLNPFQKQQYMNYAVQNPDQAIAAAQRNKDFLAATQKNTNPATPAPAPASMADGGRVFYLQGGLASLLG